MDVQSYLTHLWRAHLNLPEVRAHDDFFEIGGSSMQAIEMLMTVCTTLEKDIDYGEFFKKPCIQRLSELLDVDSPRNGISQ